MEQVIKSEQAEQEIRRGIAARYGAASYREDGQTIFAKQAQRVRLAPCPSAVRRNPPLSGAGRLPCMADVVRVVPYYMYGAAPVADAGGVCMDTLMRAALAYQNRMRVPFALMNTDSVMPYEQYGFHCICERAEYRLREGTRYRVADRGSQLALAHFVNAVLCRKYGLFAIRSARYYEKLEERLAARGGSICLIKENDSLKGYFTYIGPNVIGEVVMAEETELEQYFEVIGEERPATAARIVNLPEMLRYISSAGKVTIAIRISDPVFAQNDGLFIWYLDESGSRMERVEEPKDASGAMRPEISVTIGELTAFFFEYIKLKQNMKFDSIYLSGPAWIHENI
ncbi:MAG: hypothetical protein NC337_09545 [Roseburia sp.]|nr:hypothetical protein [Roseburia sp.]